MHRYAEKQVGYMACSVLLTEVSTCSNLLYLVRLLMQKVAMGYVTLRMLTAERRVLKADHQFNQK